MDIDTYQDQAMATAFVQDFDSDVSHFGFGLMSEAGEVAGIFQKYYRCDPKYNRWGDEVFFEQALNNLDMVDWAGFTPEAQDKLKSELGDVLWHLAAVASTFGLKLSEVAEHNVEKLAKRTADGTIKGDGDNR